MRLRYRALVLNALVLAGSTVVALFAAEIGLRLWDGVPVFSAQNFVAARIDIIHANASPFVHDPLLGWRLTDNYGKGGFMTGELGVRMNSDELKPLARNAVLAVGDSFTAGNEVNNDQSFPAHLERLLNKPVVNAASGAWGVDQMVLRAEQLIPVLHPATLVVGVFDQDILRDNFSLYGGGLKPYFVIENGELSLKGVPVPTFAAHPTRLGPWRSVLGYSYLVDWSVQRAGLLPRWIDNKDRYQRVQGDGARISGLLMERLGRLQRDLGMRVVVVMLYGADAVMAHEKPAPWVMPTINGAHRAGLLVVDMFPVLRGIYDADHDGLRPYYVRNNAGRGYGHMSSDGNLLVAKAIQGALASEDGL